MKSPVFSSAASGSRAALLPAVALLLIVATYRVWLAWQTTHGGGGALFSWLPGFCPVAALAVGSAWFLPRRLALVAPLVTLLISDLALTAIYGWQPLGGGSTAATMLGLLGRYGVLYLLGAWTLRLRRDGDAAAAALLGVTVAGSLAFYVATNTFSWLTLPGYTPTAAGWWQALTTGLPGYLPSWVFFRNALASDLLYSLLLLAACRLAGRRAPASPAPLNAPAAAAAATMR